MDTACLMRTHEGSCFEIRSGNTIIAGHSISAMWDGQFHEHEVESRAAKGGAPPSLQYECQKMKSRAERRVVKITARRGS